MWKALPVASASDVARAAVGAGADLILFSTPRPQLLRCPGGMGLAFDWSLLAGYRGALPGLAGGLNPTNAAEAIARTGAPLVDTLQRRRKRAGRQGYRQDYQFHVKPSNT